tara:strand:+ start:2085 stop:2327 length:243 start_codon:yes stop_codon:yes gene_type:complete
MNIHNLTIRIPKLPSLDLTPHKRYTPRYEDEEFFDTTTVPFNTPCMKPQKKRMKYSSKTDLYPFDTVDEFLKFYSEDLSN